MELPDGRSFTWHVAGYQSIDDSKAGRGMTDLEKEPQRILTDKELQRADVLVVHMSGIGYRWFPSGPWDDWNMLWDDMETLYDVYQ